MTARQVERIMQDLENQDSEWMDLDLEMPETAAYLGETAKQIYGPHVPDLADLRDDPARETWEGQLFGWNQAETEVEDL